MTYTEILELIRAGYTKAEIDELVKAQTAPASDPAPAGDPALATDPAPAVDPAPASDPAPAPTPASDPAPANGNSELQKLVSALGLKLDALTGAVQAHNVSSIEGKTQTETAGDIIAKIINPHYGEG